MLTPIIIVLSITLGCFVIYDLYEIIKKHNRQVEEQEKIKEAEQKVAKEKAEAERKLSKRRLKLILPWHTMLWWINMATLPHLSN